MEIIKEGWSLYHIDSSGMSDNILCREKSSSYNLYPMERESDIFTKKVTSICRDCGRNLEAILVEENGRVLLKKSCPEHGQTIDLISENAEIYKKKGDFYEAGTPVTCTVQKCKAGICPDHMEQRTSMAFIDITSRCNLNCPICYVDANFKAKDMPYEHIEKILEYLAKEEDLYCLLIIGGEPTIHRDFFKICHKIVELGLKRVTYIVTNGVKLADMDFCRKFRETGIKRIGLGFDGTTQDIYMKTRGSIDAFHKSRQAIENMRQLKRTQVVLCVTAIKGLNDDNIPDIINYALDNADIVKRILIVMGTFCGRTTRADELVAKRMTPEGLESILSGMTGSQLTSIPGAFFHKLNRPLKLLGMKGIMKSYPRLLSNQCDGFAYIGRTREGKVFSVLDRVIKEPGRLYDQMKRFDRLIGDEEKWFAKRGRGFLSRATAWAVFLPRYLLLMAGMIRPSLILVPARALLTSLFRGGLKRRMKEAVQGAASVKIWILPTGDKYNLIWDKIRTCTGHYYSYDTKREKIRRHPGCFYFPFNVEIDERNED